MAAAHQTTVTMKVDRATTSLPQPWARSSQDWPSVIGTKIRRQAFASGSAVRYRGRIRGWCSTAGMRRRSMSAQPRAA